MCPEEFTQLYLSSRSFIRNLIISLGQSAQSAEDTVQEVYLAAWDRFRESDLPENPRGWLAVAARYKACDHFRKIRREQRYFTSLELLLDGVCPPELSSLPSESVSQTSLSPFDPFLPGGYGQIESARSPLEFQLVVMRYVLGYSATETAAYFNLKLSTCSMRFARIKRKLTPLRESLSISPRETLESRPSH